MSLPALAAPQSAGSTSGDTPVEPVSVNQYHIGPDDILSIEFFGHKELDRKVRAGHDGSISLPLLGRVSVAGLTPIEAQEKIARLMTEGGLLKDPQISIFVEEYLSRVVYVQGAVEKPGEYQMFGRNSLLDVIGMAGGLSGQANERPEGQILVLRVDGTGNQIRIEIDAARLIEQGDISLNIPLRPRDTVVVPHEKKHSIYVSGAVVKPGKIEFSTRSGITLLQAITAAGGPTERARLSKVTVIRNLPDGQQERIEVNIKKIRNGKEDDIVLRNNDTVVVSEFFF